MRAVNVRDTGDTAAMIGGITEGLQFVLYKPFRLDQLVTAIEQTVEARQQRA